MPSARDESDRLTRMLTKQLELQRHLGTDPTQVPLEERARWVAEMLFAMTTEIGEASNEIGWKRWASSSFVNDQACFGELRDIFQFLVNAMFTVHQVSPAELAELLETALDDKLVKNRARADSGYSGTEKCPGCRRALDEVKLTPYRGAHTLAVEQVLCACGTSLDVRVASPFID